MTIEFDQSCGIPPSLNPMTYELTARKGFLGTTEARPRPLTGFVNNYSFMTWNMGPSFNDDLDSGKCGQPDHISEQRFTLVVPGNWPVQWGAFGHHHGVGVGR